MNFEQTLNELTIDKIKKYAYSLPEEIKTNSFFTSYQKLIDFTKSCLNSNNKNSLIGIAHMCYGWMPTMLEYNNIEDSNTFLEQVNNGCLNSKFLSKVKKTINNSIIGGSKFLHFLNPQNYAIFDSRVYEAITKSKSYNYNTNNIANYQKYVLKLRELSNESDAKEMKEFLLNNNFVLQETSLLRCIEMCLFYSTGK